MDSSLFRSSRWLLHFYQGARSENQETIYASFNTGLAAPDNVDWTRESFNPILAMLALSATQDLTCFRFGEGVNLKCAERILEMVKAVKRRPVAFLCLLIDILTMSRRSTRPMGQMFILEAVEQVMHFLDEDSTTCLLRPMASELQWHLQTSRAFHRVSRISVTTVTICNQLLVKYAASPISSAAQLRLLSCARSTGVAKPAMGWLTMHMPL
jgi:hypothetical protein